MQQKDRLRLDKYLWAIRIFKTRAQAAEACDKGKVKSQGLTVKAAKHINVGDEYEIKTEARRWTIKVTGMLDHRVQYTEAIKYYNDITPEEEKQRIEYQAAVFRKSKIEAAISP